MLRMSWQKYFMNICYEVSNRSACMSRKLGAVLVRDNIIISSGYNGPPRGISSCSERYVKDKVLIEELKGWSLNIDENNCPRKILRFRSGEGLEWCYAAHAERNCLLNAARLGIATNKADLYLSGGIPCKDCLIELIQAGIKTVYVTEDKFYDIHSEYLLINSTLNIEVVE